MVIKSLRRPRLFVWLIPKDEGLRAAWPDAGSYPGTSAFRIVHCWISSAERP